jgi:hypothetical protein
MPRRNSDRRSGNGPGEMGRIEIDPRTAERLLAGRATDSDLSAPAEGVVRVLSAARQAAAESDLSGLDATVAAMVATAVAANAAGTAVAKPPLPPSSALRRTGPPSWVPKLLTVSVAGLTALFGALAAAGALPSSAQRPVADIVSHVGIDIPRPAATPDAPGEPAATTTTTPGETTTTTVAPPGETTGTTAVTSETTVAAQPCGTHTVSPVSGCIEPQPQTPTTLPSPTTTQPPPPPTTVPPTTTTVPSDRAPQSERTVSRDH